MTIPLKIGIILGSTRENRFSEKPGRWLFSEIQKQPDIEARLLDLRDYSLPFLNTPTAPSDLKGVYSDPAVTRWSKEIASLDGFVIIAPEYNHGYPAILKNAIDWLFDEWARKPVAFFAYGDVGGARSVEQLRQVVIELKMVPIPRAIHLPYDLKVTLRKAPEPLDPALFAPVQESTDRFIKELMEYAQALKAMRG